MASPDSFDTIIVGAGSAGCVLAARLSEDPAHRVLLVEVGPDFDPSDPPEQIAFLGRGYQWPIEWGDEVQSSDGRTLPYLRGRGIGGSSSINGGVAMRAEPKDFASWPRGWSWEEVLPWFCRLESDLDYGERDYHGDAGPIPIRRWSAEEHDPTQQAFVDGALKRGIPACPDHNEPNTTGVGPIPMNRDGKRRLSAGLTHLAPARERPNLEVRSDAWVQRLSFDGTRCSGVEFADGTRALAGRVVSCAGVLQSPLLMLRSGVGPADELRSLGVAPIVDAPAVGAHWTDHMVVNLSTTIDERWIRRGARGIQSLARISSPDGEYDNDLQLTPWAERLQDGGYRLNLSCSLQQPYSEARVRLRDLDPASRGHFEWTFPSDVRNMERLRFGAREGLLLLEAAGVSNEASELSRRAARSDGEFDDWIAAEHGAFYHGAGSCRMGEDDATHTSVLTPECRVRGTEDLYVIDASSAPRVPRSNTHILVVALAERMAAVLCGRAQIEA